MRLTKIKSFSQPWAKSNFYNSRNYKGVSSFGKSNLNPIRKSLKVYRGDVTKNVIQQKTKKKEEKPLILPRRTAYAWKDFPEEKKEISKNKKQKFLKKFKNHITRNKKKYLIFIVTGGSLVGSFFISKTFKKRKMKKQEKKDLQRKNQQKELILQRERTRKEKEIKQQREREREMEQEKEREKKQEERELQRERERRESKLKFTKRQGVTKKKKKSKS